VTAINLTNGGTGYTAAPAISFASGGGAGAVAAATISGGVVAAIAPVFGPNNTVNTINFDSANNRWLIGGSFTSYNGGSTLNRLARISASGAIDSSFNPNVNGTVLGIFVQPADGAVLFAGSFGTVGGATSRLLARVNGTTAVRDAALGVAFRSVGAVNKIMPLPGGNCWWRERFPTSETRRRAISRG